MSNKEINWIPINISILVSLILDNERMDSIRLVDGVH